MILLRASARKLHDFSLSMTHNSHSQARDSDETLYSKGSVKHTIKATRTQVREFLFFRELTQEANDDDRAVYCSFQKQTSYTFRGYVLLREM